MKELRGYKAELVVIVLLSTVLLGLRYVSANVWPTTGQYDLAAQTETVFWTVLRLVIYSLAAWVGLRAVAPKAYQHLKHDTIDAFDKLPVEQRSRYSLRMYAILFFGLVLLALSGCSPAQAATLATDQRTCVVMNAAADVGVREASGHNDGPEVERYLAHVGLGAGHPWCAAFVSYELSACGVRNPRSAWSPAFASVADQVWTPRKASRSPRPGDVFSIYFARLGRVGHVGLVSSLDGGYINTIEGNTSAPGSRDGDGVYARRRQLSKVHAITNYIRGESPGAGPLGLYRGHGHTGIGMPGQADTGGEPVRYAADGSALRRAAARYFDTSAGQPRGGFASTAAAGHGPAAYHGTQRPGLEHRGDHRWHPDTQRGLRQHGAGRYAVGSLGEGVPGAYGGPYALRARRGARYAQVGLVCPGHGPAACAVEAVAFDTHVAAMTRTERP
jgi:hypothetical protein